jgi:hypothetical protein
VPEALVVVVVVLLAAAVVYLLISFGVFGAAGKAGRSLDDETHERGEHDREP